MMAAEKKASTRREHHLHAGSGWTMRVALSERADGGKLIVD